MIHDPTRNLRSPPLIQMPSFPQTFWSRLQDFKDAPALYTVDTHRKTLTFWQWTRRLQNLAMALMDAGFQTGQRVGLVAPNGQNGLDLALASWLVGGCLVPVNPQLNRDSVLRCLGRSGCDWIVVNNQTTRSWLRGDGQRLPDHLQWVVFDGDDGDDIHPVDQLERRGRHLVQRGHHKKLAKRIYELDDDTPTLILFEPRPGDDAEGALFSGRKVQLQLERIAAQMGLSADDDVAIASAIPFGWFSSFLMIAASLYDGHPVALPCADEPLADQLETLRPTLLICNREVLRELADDWQHRLDDAPDILKKLLDADESDAPAVSKALGRLGEKAARKLLYEPIRDEFGGQLEALQVFEGHCPPGLRPILDGADIALRGHFGLPESGVTHVEHPDAHRPDSCGRPIEGIATKLLDAKTGDPGELCIRGDTLFDDYWAGEGPRRVDDDGWLHTGRTARLESGFLFLS